MAVVTGAGRGLGRAYARLLAERGAAVVVNDLGGSMGGRGADHGPATEAVAEIEAAGGRALADTHDVSTPDGGQALIDAAREHFGRIDILVTNAGIMRWAGLPELDAEALADHLAVHVGGTFHPVRAAWPHLVDQGYGRIVMTTSAGVFGLPTNTAYAAAKGGVIGLARSAALTGADHGIAVNCIAPAAWTRMAAAPGAPGADEPPPDMAPDLVAPMVAYLAHEDCPVTGHIYAAGSRRFSRLFLATTPGYVAAGPEVTVEDVAEHWAAINDESGYQVPADLLAWSADFLSHLSDRPTRGSS